VRFEEQNAQVLGISGDSLETHMKFARQNKISFPLLADERREIRQLFGGGRITYIVDRDGIIRFVQKGIPDNKVLLKELEKL
jgi:peroxiredoxin Q/BCP